MVTDSARRARWHRCWDRHSTTYDREMRFFDRVLRPGGMLLLADHVAGPGAASRSARP